MEHDALQPGATQRGELQRDRAVSDPAGKNTRELLALIRIHQQALAHCGTSLLGHQVIKP